MFLFISATFVLIKANWLIHSCPYNSSAKVLHSGDEENADLSPTMKELTI